MKESNAEVSLDMWTFLLGILLCEVLLETRNK